MLIREYRRHGHPAPPAWPAAGLGADDAAQARRPAVHAAAFAPPSQEPRPAPDDRRRRASVRALSTMLG
jgi:hypothetical protein